MVGISWILLREKNIPSYDCDKDEAEKWVRSISQDDLSSRNIISMTVEEDSSFTMII